MTDLTLIGRREMIDALVADELAGAVRQSARRRYSGMSEAELGRLVGQRAIQECQAAIGALRGRRG